jgi:hypothetical protein
MSRSDELDSLFSEPFAAAGGTLSRKELDEVQHFLEVNEMGLALETMADTHAEERKSPPRSVLDLMKRVAIKLAIEPEFILRRMRIPQ